MDNFIKEKDIIDIDEKEKSLQIMQSIIKTRQELNQAHKNFEFAEEELVDFYTYQIKASQAKLDYLTRLAKSKNMAINIADSLSINKAV